MDNLTVKLVDAFKKAEQIALFHKQQVIEPCHLLLAMINDNDSIVSYILNDNGVDIKSLKDIVKSTVKSQPTQSGNETEKAYLSNTVEKVYAYAKSKKALEELDISGMQMFITPSVFFFAMFQVHSQTSMILHDLGLTQLKIKDSINKLGGGSADDVNGESNFASLEKFSRNLNALAEAGKLDPVIGRDDEMRRILQTLSRRKKNNPMIVGEPGTGKSVLVDLLAQRIVGGDVPNNLKNKKLFELQMSSIVAGAMYKGQFEERLKAVIDEASKDPDVILFIDEIHTLVGGNSGGMDAANILKPVLARGELRVIGATTTSEYQKYIEKDKALERRFQPIIVEAPSVEDTISILRGIKDTYETYHKVQINDDAVVAAVKLSDRYITDRFLPDKAIDLLDESCARMKLEINSSPEELDTLNRQINQIKIEIEGIKREVNTNGKLKKLEKQLSKLSDERDKMSVKWQTEKDIVDEINTVKLDRENLIKDVKVAHKNGDYAKVAEIEYGTIPEKIQKLEELNEKLDKMHEESVLINEEVTENDVAEIISKWINIPVSKMLSTDKERLLNLENELHKRVVGQHEAIVALSDSVRRSRSGVDDGKKPPSFIFLGTTGVGKTELVKALAEVLFNDENAILRIDMSEYQEKFAVSRLLGSPPGYVGYDEAGAFDGIRRQPYQIVLLDEFEKGHADVFNILLQIFDEGRLTDTKGRVINFKNTIIIMTSNLGSHIIQEKFTGMNDENREEKVKEVNEEVKKLMKQYLRPELLNRIDKSIIFEPLTKSQIREIVILQLNALGKRLNLDFSENIINFIAEEGYVPEYGARPIKRVIQERLLNELSIKLISEEVTTDNLIHVDYVDNEITFKN